jgi:hypothetical protein
LGVTIWAYRAQLRSTSAAWRWVAFGLRIAAVILCLLASLRPSLMLDEKKKQASSIVFLIDSSSSMIMADEVGLQKRWVVAKKALDSATKAMEGKSKDLEVKVYRFDTDLHDYKAEDTKDPNGRETDLGSMLLKAVKDNSGSSRVTSVVLLSDGASNGGISPLVAANQLRANLIPVVTVGVGTIDAGKNAKDIAVRDLVAGPTVFVKNQPEIRGTISVRGFGGQPIEVELYVDRDPKPVATKTINVPIGAEVISVTGLKYLPEIPGEKRMTLKVKPREGELVTTNNEVSSYLDVLKGGLKVLFVQGPDFSWDVKYLPRSLDAAREIHADLKVIREPARGDRGLLDDADFAPGQYDVYILSGLPADYLTRLQIRALVNDVEKGAGLIMLGGRGSFGSGGWSRTELAQLLPVNISPSDGQIDWGDEGMKVVPDPLGLENFVMRLAPNPTESARIWTSLAPITGSNRFGAPKPSAFVLARAGGEPVMVGSEYAKGRVLAFGGETWPWYRGSDEGRLAHARFWRQSILWLAHKENQGESQVKVKLDTRRVAVGQKLEISGTARDAKDEPIPEAQYETTVTRLDETGKPVAGSKPEPVPLYPQGDEARGPYFATGEPGEYEVTLKGTKGGKEIGTDHARFMVYQDNRELENPAADRALLKEISVITGGVSLNSEDLEKHLKALAPDAADYVTQSEHKLWDNWTFFLIFVGLLTAEWALRKAKGWV